MSIKIIPHFCIYFENIDGYPSKSFAFPQFCFKCHPKTFGLVLDLMYSFWGQKKGVVAMLEKWDYIPWCPPRFQRLHHFGAEVCLNQQWMSISCFTTRTGSIHLSTINSMVKLILLTHQLTASKPRPHPEGDSTPKLFVLWTFMVYL